MKINPPLITLVIALAMLAVSSLLPQGRLIPPPWNALGLTWIALGVAMNLWSVRWFRFKQTSINPRGNPNYLAQEGLYRYTRNPMYLGMLISLLGLSFYLGSLFTLLGPALYVWMLQTQFIRREEQILQVRFGEAYTQYAARVRRWI